jgi:putative transposase
VMARPTRNADPQQIARSDRIFFATTRTSMSRRIFQSERNATLLIDVLRTYVAIGKFKIHDFVIMPDHVHLLISVSEGMSIERAMQLIKGGFSFRLRKKAKYLGEVWQKGFSEIRVDNDESYAAIREYIVKNPVKAGLVETPEQYPYCYIHLKEKRQKGG